jgi:hypothetical protein
VLPGFPCLPPTTLLYFVPFFFSIELGNCEIITKFFFFYRAAEEGEHAFVFFCNQRNKRELRPLACSLVFTRERRWKGPFHQGEVFFLFYLGFYALNPRRKE